MIAALWITALAAAWCVGLFFNCVHRGERAPIWAAIGAAIAIMLPYSLIMAIIDGLIKIGGAE